MRSPKLCGESSAPPHSYAVYDGRQHLGELIDRGFHVIARLADGFDLGTFPNRDAATHAIIAAARSRDTAEKCGR